MEHSKDKKTILHLLNMDGSEKLTLLEMLTNQGVFKLTRSFPTTYHSNKKHEKRQS